jgi:hypothetical protein
VKMHLSLRLGQRAASMAGTVQHTQLLSITVRLLRWHFRTLIFGCHLPGFLFRSRLLLGWVAV